MNDIITKQTELALDYLYKYNSLITYKNLVPVKEKQIDEYIKSTSKIFPNDYRYWLTKHGSGRIEFIETEITIISVHELFEDDGRSVYEDEPANCWKRIYLDYGGAPIINMLDTTIIDENGCCPVITTKDYSNEVEKVLASSWPMYIISSILFEGREIMDRVKADRTYRNNISKETLENAEELSTLQFESIDKQLVKATSRAMKHNETTLVEGEPLPDIGEFISGQFEKYTEGKELEKQNSIDNVETAINILEDYIYKGYACLGCNYSVYLAKCFLLEEVAASDKPKLRKLLEHPRREVREIAQEGLDSL